MTSDIKLFLKKFFIFLTPFIVVCILAFSMDPFKIWFEYDDYYKNNFVTLNRELVCFKLFKQNKDIHKYNSFIFGSSRSQAFKIKEWKKYLDEDSLGFHFDASGEGIYGIYNKLNYLEKNNLPIKNVLILLDYDTLTTTKNRQGYLFISPPELSGEASYKFYKEFIVANISPIFILGYLDYKIFSQYRDYMSALFNKSKYDNVSDNITADLFYGYDQMIKEDNDGYYKKLVEKGIFDRNKKHKSIEKLGLDEKDLLEKISRILKRNKSNYKIIISPVYDQISIDKERLDLIELLFDKNNVFNFSGKNKFTESIYNYYEDSHYRPHVANQIMEQIYITN
jgi:hypothetical protein